MSQRKSGTITLIGSGELAESMSRVHRQILSRIEGEVQAVFLNTPAGFELNADEISDKAVEYFAQRFSLSLQIADFKNREVAGAVELEAALRPLLRSNYIFAGPGSPSYALRHWSGTPVWEAVLARFADGAHIVLASAAAITVGCCALPVYEIYKAGQDPHWLGGLDLLAQLGLELAVIPHWNNAEGGTFDTRFCYMGAPRLERLEQQLPASTIILGVDEYTACTIDPASEQCTVMGAGQVTVRYRGHEWFYPAGATFGFDRLRTQNLSGAPISPGPPAPAESAQAEAAADDSTRVTGRYLHELAHALTEAREQDLQRDLIEQVHDSVHELSAEWLEPGMLNANVTPLVDLLVGLRDRLRAARQFALADYIRQELGQLGYVIQDRPGGAVWKKREGDGG